MADAPKVYLSKDANVPGIAAEFEKCCLSSLGCRGHTMDVGYSYKNGKLNVYPSEQGHRLEHPTGCPCRFLTPTDIASMPINNARGVNIGVSVILQSSDKHVLLTRRAKHMRTSPGIWVPPGGHVEPGETLKQGCLRELKEETGLSFTEEDLNLTTLGLWESVYPPLIAMALPTRHHIVVYLSALAKEDSSTLQQRLKFNEEVDATTWLDQNTAAEVVSSDEYGQSKKMPQRYFKAWMKTNHLNLPLSILMSVLPPPGSPTDCERLSSGTKFALSEWQKSLHKPPVQSFWPE